MNLNFYLHQHPYDSVIALWVITNMVLYMPPPQAQSSGFYKWVFGVLHAIVGALPRVFSNFLPAGSMIWKILSGGNGASVNGANPMSGGDSSEGTQPGEQGKLDVPSRKE
jgi:hypothetical protein